MSGFRKLKEAKQLADGNLLLTVRARQAWIIRKDGQRTLYVRLDRDDEILTTSKERQQHFAVTLPNHLRTALYRAKNSSESGVRQIASSDNPIEVVSGDVCMILELWSAEYMVSFYRDIPPVGWTIPGGCPNTYEKLLRPDEVAAREACEEVLITDARGVLYIPQTKRVEILETMHIACKTAEAWGLDSNTGIFLPVEEFAPLTKENRDADRIVFGIGDTETCVENVGVTIDPQIASATATLYWKMRLPIAFDELHLFDGEKLPDGSLLNRPVRLSRVEGGDTVAIFQNGRRVSRAEWKQEWIDADWITEGTKRQVSIR